ncbi:MAG: hypothetical protein II417_00010 [Elusimicrobia bacterium]|nr:hypothetical protein [Elusimicrobiota bacterium]
MKVKDLIEELKKMPQDKTICFSTMASENCLDIKDIKDVGSWVELVSEDIDFKLDEEGLANIEEEQDEIARENAIDRQIDEYLGK